MTAPERIIEAVFAVIGAFFALSIITTVAYVALRRSGWRIR